MIKRVVSVTRRCVIKTQNEQIVIKDTDSDESLTVPIEDLGLLELDTTQATVTTALLAKLAESSVAAVICNSSHHPIGMLVPLYGHSQHALKLRQQINATLPMQKRAWQEIVKRKISNQADVLDLLGYDSKGLRRRIAKVMSSDSTNQEGVAAAAYWRELLEPFDVTRDPDGPFPNNVLNYGYAVVRACVARGLVGSGLHPAIGLMHSHRGNPFALADDMMEPYRPFVDAHIFSLLSKWGMVDDLTKEVKADVLQVLTVDTFWKEGRRPLFNAIQLSTASLSQVFAGDRELPLFPSVCE